MPANYAHKVFGAKVYRKLEPETKQLIQKNLPYFLIGLHGPDILFFHRPGSKSAIGDYGRLLHHTAFKDFFLRARDVLLTSPDDEKLVYMYGVLCHLFLDGYCHPWVKEAKELCGVTHGLLETELERELLRLDGRRELSFPTAAHVGISMEYARHIAPFYEGISEQEIFECLIGYRLVGTVTRRESKTARKLVCEVMKMAGYEGKVASLVMSRQASRQCRGAVKKLISLSQEAEAPAREAIEGFAAQLFSGKLPEYSTFSFYGETKETV